MVSDPRAYVCAEQYRRGGAPGGTLDDVLVFGALGVLILSLVAVMRRRTVGADPDLGWVSERWLAEYRADSTRPSL
jgi:hypothetical protein